MVVPTAGDSIREAHSYEYDNNGNILYVNTLRLKPDMTAQSDTVQRTREEKFRWDEENRLTALSQNGYVSHYWYDADGERTDKMHGGNIAVFVNSRQDGRVLDTQQTTAYFSPYFSPYFSIHEGRFTKHLYIGSERVASMTGTLSPASQSPVGEAVQLGYIQEMTDRIAAKHSAYSYEDLPSDRFGAIFGAQYFDPTSKLSLGEQLLNYLNSLGATSPMNAPNYNILPISEPTQKPSQVNHSTTPIYTK